uniref:Uncharacterized protein n=1 Tax=Panagrolaimus sp. JU765 TaxID=591449 RepID=A0AC34QJJ0_9BILA
MFIISKIVRGRRLLQEMEEDTKENEHKKQQKKKDKEMKEILNFEDNPPDTSTSVQPSDAMTGILNRRK